MAYYGLLQKKPSGNQTAEKQRVQTQEAKALANENNQESDFFESEASANDFSIPEESESDFEYSDLKQGVVTGRIQDLKSRIINMMCKVEGTKNRSSYQVDDAPFVGLQQQNLNRKKAPQAHSNYLSPEYLRQFAYPANQSLNNDRMALEYKIHSTADSRQIFGSSLDSKQLVKMSNFVQSTKTEEAGIFNTFNTLNSTEQHHQDSDTNQSQNIR